VIRISINPNRSDVGLNLEYAETQLDRAMKKTLRHHPKNSKLKVALNNALVSIRQARAAIQKGTP
jgi:hypothetical protein